ncbi:MAG: ATP synthase F1 subunit delta [Clostridium sp.]|jgi:ATP synthase F1, delta subunit|nr:ATP synthase F1 subunit delta [Clostridium sp.]
MTSKTIDNKLIPLAKRYSDALSEVAKSKNELDNVKNDLQTVCEAMDSVAELANFLAHPVIPLAEKKEMVKSVFEGKINNDVLNLIFILLEKNKINILGAILYCFEESMDAANNILKVGVISAVEIDDDLKQRLKEKLEQKLQKSVKFEFDINPEIIAGLVLKIQDKTIDGSMAAKLEGFKKVLR